MHKNDFKISIIIRTYNEQKYLGKVLQSISKQIYKNYEVIIVDSESTDSTLEIANQFSAKIIHILKKDFNYSYASNIGAQNAEGDILCFLSGHSVPLKKDFLLRINNAFNLDNVGGVYGDVVPFRKNPLVEKSFYYLGFLKNKLSKREYFEEKEIHPGILSCSNAAILKSVWSKHNFAEALGKGGEDVEMADYILKSGFKILFLKKMIVRHSHHKKMKDFKKELENWKNLYSDVLKYLNK